jgi:hypothetical protein
MSTLSSQMGAYSNSSTPLIKSADFDAYAANALTYQNGNTSSMFRDSHIHPHFATADDFTAWLFKKPHLTASPGGLRHGSTSVGATAFMHESGSMPRGPRPQPIPQQNFMAVKCILDPGLTQIDLSKQKRQDILYLIKTRFTDSAPVKKRKDYFLGPDTDRDLDEHVLSLRSM